jgi:hypothetical protein
VFARLSSTFPWAQMGTSAAGLSVRRPNIRSQFETCVLFTAARILQGPIFPNVFNAFLPTHLSATSTEALNKYPRCHQRIHQRIVQNPNECPLPWPSQQRPHRSRTRTTCVVGRNPTKQPAQFGSALHPPVRHSRSAIHGRKRDS